METRICFKCCNEKVISEFYKAKDRKGIYRIHYQCLMCFNKYRKDRYKNNESIRIKHCLHGRKRKKFCIDCKIKIYYKKKTLRCRSCANKIKWLNLDYRTKMEQLNVDRWKDEKYKNKILNSVRFKLSNLHKKIKNELMLESYGFKSEQIVNDFLVDELNKEKKIIIEINGNYVHANPFLYKENDIIRLPGNHYTAKEKWTADYNRNKKLESLGYKIYVIWETDDYKKVFEEIKKSFPSK